MELTLKEIHKSFGDNHVLKGISFTARTGAAFALLGRNGHGKTTAIRIIMNIFSQDSGNVLIDGVKNTESKVKMSYLPEERGLYAARLISEQMVYFGMLKGLNKTDAKNESKRLLEKLEMEQHFDKKLNTLSKGNQQKIQLAITLLADPDIIILDEPFSGLDPVNAQVMNNAVVELIEKGKIVVFSSHEMANVESFCDEICIINHGQIAIAGNLAEIKRTYRRDRIGIIPEDGNSIALHEKIKNFDGIKNIIENKGECIVTLNEPSLKDKLLANIVNNNINISKFDVLEPSLQEIFIEKAGVVNESV
ncbi:MAG: ATP-binding cassette domain-containing protein [Defluviitaleaceae bacterium]|nr:ATP-binding cassette domain-containing protein [Defluviitaleaceae bacterium]